MLRLTGFRELSFHQKGALMTIAAMIIIMKVIILFLEIIAMFKN